MRRPGCEQPGCFFCVEMAIAGRGGLRCWGRRSRETRAEHGGYSPRYALVGGGSCLRSSLSCSEISRRLALIWRRVARREARLSMTEAKTARQVTPTDIVTPSVTI